MSKLSKNGILINLLLLLSLLVTISSVSAADNSTDLGNLISNSVDGSVIQLDGIYKNNVTNILIDKNITIIGKDKKTSVIDAQRTGRIFSIANNGTLTLINVSIINCRINNDNGGAIYNTGKLTINGVDFINNEVNVHFNANGGVIYNTGNNMVIINSNFINNNIIGYYGVSGGAIYNNANDMYIANTSFVNTTSFIVGGSYSGHGGAIANSGRNMTIVNCNFTNNSATNGGNGGAIYNFDNGNYMNVINSNFNNNSADLLYFTVSGSGGAIYSNCNNVNIINSTFNNNKVDNSSGGAIYSSGDNLKISNSNFTNNRADSNGGAIYSYGILNAYYNNIFYNNIAFDNGGAIYNGGILNASYNIFYNNTDVNNKTFVSNNVLGVADYNFWGTNDISGLYSGITVNNFYKMVITNTTPVNYYSDKVKLSYKLVDNATNTTIGVEKLPAFNATLWYNNQLLKQFDGKISTEFDVTLKNLSNIFEVKFYGDVITSTQLNVGKIPTNLDLTVIGKDKVNSTIKLVAKLSYNHGIGGEKVVFYLNGKKIGEATTNSNGIATLYYKIPNAGVFSFSAEYAGSDYLLNSSSLVSTIYVVDNLPDNNNTNNTNHTNKTSNNPVANATMKETGIPIIAVILILLSSLGLIVRKK